jgi:hypothetical protein
MRFSFNDCFFEKIYSKINKKSLSFLTFVIVAIIVKTIFTAGLNSPWERLEEG